MALTIDTLRTARTLEAGGFTPDQAEALTYILAELTREPRLARVGDVDVASFPPARGVRRPWPSGSFKLWLVASQIGLGVAIAAVLHLVGAAG